MRAIATDGVTWSVCLSACVSVCLLITFMSPAKTAESIEMPFVRADSGGPMEPLLDGVQILQEKETILGVVRPTKKHWEPLL